MKKTATLDRINNEQESYGISKSSLPRISYNVALDLVVTLPGGAIRSVRSLDASEMRALVETCALTAKSPKACAGAVKGLDYNHLIDRWFAILELRLYGATLPLAPAENTV